METVKEKLTKLIEQAERKNPDCGIFPYILAEELAQNGVTIQEWVSVEERLPDKTGSYIVCTAKNTVYCAKYYANGKHFGIEMNTHITHWMPLPDPPKGVQE